MALFRKKAAEAPISTTQEPAAVDQDFIGPWDITERSALGDRIDLGAIRVPKRAGMQMRMEVDKQSRRVVAVNVGLDSSALQLQAFAAPRSQGLWDELREELSAQIAKQGGAAQVREGVFGEEIFARLPVRLPDGRSGHRAARFLGVDGPRWFLRGVMTGKALDDEILGAQMDSLFGDIVVVRGDAPAPPRELLTLHMPGSRSKAAPSADKSSLDMLRRGPEITEIR